MSRSKSGGPEGRRSPDRRLRRPGRTSGRKHPTDRIFILNGTEAGKAITRQLVSSLNSRTVRIEKGGYLFKASATEQHFYLGIVPYVHQGQRNYHHDIPMPETAEFVLVGNLNPDGVFTLLFIPPAGFPSREAIAGYAEQYRIFASQLLSLGLDGPGPLDDVTRDLLKSSGVRTDDPGSLADLAESPDPSD